MPERVFEKNHMKMIESIQNLEHAVLNQYSSLNAILSFARVNIPAINKQIRAGKLKISDKSRIIRKHLPKYVKDLIRKQNRTSIRVKRVKSALNTFANKIPRKYHKIIAEFKEKLDKYDDFFMAEFSFQNGSLKEFLEVKKYFHEVKTEDFQKYFYTYIKNRAKKLTIIGYLALIKDMQDYFSSKKEEILTDVLKNLMFASTVRLDDVDIRIINGKDICYIYDSSFLKYLESDREKNMKSQVRLLFSIDGEKILLKSVVKELTHKGKSHHKPLISSSSLRYFQRTSVSKGIRPTTEEKGLFLGLLDLKVGRGAEKEEIEKNKFLKGADVRILALVSRLLRKEKFVVILTNDTDISKIITKLKRKRKTRLIWEYCSVYGYFGGTQKLA